jgi:hypothetical protein
MKFENHFSSFANHFLQKTARFNFFEERCFFNTFPLLIPIILLTHSLKASRVIY